MEEKPFFSIVILARDYSYLLPITIESILLQFYPSYEILIVMDKETSPVHEILESYKDKIAEVVHTQDDNLANMMNQGVSRAKGEYIHFLHPGDLYLTRHALEHVAELSKSNPEIVYCGFLLRTGGLPEAVVHPLNVDLLKVGKLPTRMQSFWFSKNIFKMVGTFNRRYRFRPGFEIICRIFDNKDCRIVFTKRVLVDYEYRKIPPSEMLKFAFETFFLILKNFGPIRAFSWWFIQDQIGLFKWMKSSIKQAFWQPL